MISWHRVRDQSVRALGLAPDEAACVLRQQWAIGDIPAAVTATHVIRQAAAPFISAARELQPGCRYEILPLGRAQDSARARPAAPARSHLPLALCVEMQQAPPWAARCLRLHPAEHATVITMTFGDKSPPAQRL